jgi:hypothetical protein
MRSGEYIQRKFQTWAQRHNIELQGSEGERGEPNYTLTLVDNLYKPLSDEARREFEQGAGGELKGDIPSMQALHSSAAMAVNLFHYWKQKELFSEAAKILRIPSSGIKSISFERKYPVIANHKLHGFTEPPHLDVGVDYENATDIDRVGIECKLFEPYGRLEHQGLAEKYLDLAEAWGDIPRCRELAEELAEGSAGFNRLGPTQLMRHILGLKYGLTKKRFRLIYLYLDAPGDEAAEHRAEVERFQSIMRADGIWFVPIPVQRLVFRAIQLQRDGHREFIDYLSERYI